MTDPLGQSQVIPYVEGLTKKGYKFTVLSYEKPDRYKAFGRKIKKQLEESDIKWKPMMYHKKFSVLATLYDLFRGFLFLLVFIPRKKIKLIHCRSYISSILGLIFKKLYGTKFIFDMRGFWADERIEGGIFKNRFLYKFFKWLEKQFLLNADATISLTVNAIEEMKTWPYMSEEASGKIHHITTCSNTTFYNKTFNSRINKDFIDDKITFLYIGSIGPWHSYKEITGFVRYAYKNYPGSFFRMIINWGIEDFEKFVDEEKFDRNRFFIGSISHKEIPDALQDADIGFFFIPPVYAKKSSSPTKMGEMLAAGIPIITGHSIGDVDYLLEKHKIGCIIKEFNPASFKTSIESVKYLIKENKKELMDRCLYVANDYFSLENGIERYYLIYRNLLSDAR